MMLEPPLYVSSQSDRSNVTFFSFVLEGTVFKAGGSRGTTATIEEQTSLITLPTSLKASTFVKILSPFEFTGSLVIV